MNARVDWSMVSRALIQWSQFLRRYTLISKKTEHIISLSSWIDDSIHAHFLSIFYPTSMDPSPYIVIERVDLISKTTVEGTLYGLTLALYILCVKYLYIQLACGVFELAVDARIVQVSYVDHANFPGGGYFYSWNVLKRELIVTVGNAVGILLDFMMSSVQIWRLWVLWRVSQYSLFIMIIPSLSLIAYTVLQVIGAVALSRPEAMKQSIVLCVYASQGVELIVPIYVTTLIVARISSVRRQHVKIMGQSEVYHQYTSIISMLVESFALEALWMTIGTVFDFVNLTVQSPHFSAACIFFAATQPVIRIFAYLLVVYRVTTGRGWKENTEEKLTTLEWNRERLETSQLPVVISRLSVHISSAA
ncbi:hypothetical protein NP233_g8343 [Leucocoprinus birnbaumii]|uniref:Uncharacterized protein n=1 Tax=Leucocoprinus birnbaumii TaxID=56174 RepID=A0AAD5VP61_9AGAR|nr:hypothetical protein NP233_g8343 [Leucocoprinus birnbaumii]